MCAEEKYHQESLISLFVLKPTDYKTGHEMYSISSAVSDLIDHVVALQLSALFQSQLILFIVPPMYSIRIGGECVRVKKDGVVSQDVLLCFISSLVVLPSHLLLLQSAKEALSQRVYPNNPHSTVNSIRFVTNCDYGFRSPFEEIVHYSTLSAQDVRFGALREVKVRPKVYRAQ